MKLENNPRIRLRIFHPSGHRLAQTGQPTDQEQKAIKHINHMLGWMTTKLEQTLVNKGLYARLVVGVKPQVYYLALTREEREERRLNMIRQVDGSVFRAGDPLYLNGLLRVALEQRTDPSQPTLRLGEILFSRLNDGRLSYHNTRPGEDYPNP